jgi:hypothetical protein
MSRQVKKKYVDAKKKTKNLFSLSTEFVGGNLIWHISAENLHTLQKVRHI